MIRPIIFIIILHVLTSFIIHALTQDHSIGVICIWFTKSVRFIRLASHKSIYMPFFYKKNVYIIPIQWREVPRYWRAGHGKFDCTYVAGLYMHIYADADTVIVGYF